MRRIMGDYYRYLLSNKWTITIPCAVVFLNILGLLVLSSASLSFVRHNYLLRQLSWLVLALIGCLMAAFVPIGWLKKKSRIFYFVALILLVIVLIPGIGIRVNGSRRWLYVGIGRFQVSEYAKIAFALFFPKILIKSSLQQRFIPSLCIPMVHIGVFSALLLLEPDYGTTALFLLVGMTLLFLNGFSAKILFACGILTLCLFALMVMLNPVRLARVLAFMDVEATKSVGSYQLWQGLVGFRSGGLFGVGPGNGRQQLFYLPEAHTDFIFPVLAEELGYVFSLLAVGAYVLMFIVMWIEIFHIQSPFLFLVANGIALFLTMQIAINLGVVMGLLPTKGIALPFMSYGGSNLIFSYAAIGLLLNIFRTSYGEDLSWNRSACERETS